MLYTGRDKKEWRRIGMAVSNDGVTWKKLGESALIGVGEGNDYGHPYQGTLDDLEAIGATVYRTDLNGSIVVESDGKGLTVEAER